MFFRIFAAMKIRLTREFSFEMAHCLEGYDGLCRHIHGHSYKMFVTVLGEPCDDIQNPKYGMVMDFTDLKAIVNSLVTDRYDHALVMRQTVQNVALVNTMRAKWERIHLTEYQPTCERMIQDFVVKLQAALPEHVTLVELTLYETEKSAARWLLSDNIL